MDLFWGTLIDIDYFISFNNFSTLIEKKVIRKSFSDSDLNEANNKDFVILTNKKLSSVANNINEYLKILGYRSRIVYEFNKKNEKNNEIYFILYIKFFTELNNELPKKYIVLICLLNLTIRCYHLHIKYLIFLKQIIFT